MRGKRRKGAVAVPLASSAVLMAMATKQKNARARSQMRVHMRAVA